MTHLIFILLVPFLGQPTTEINDSSLSIITQALKNGSIETLGTYFDQSVEVSILKAEDTYQRTKAIKLVGDFFNSHPPQDFVPIHNGTSKGQDAKYCIGNLKTKDGIFRVYFYVKVTEDDYLIQELRFDEE